MEVNWIQIGLTVVGMVGVGGVAVGTMRAQLHATRETLKMYTGIFHEQIKELKADTTRDREQCERRCTTQINESKASTRESHTRLDRHIEQHPGPAGVVG